MERNIVEQLLKGSEEIDRMRSEINQIIAMMIGYLSKTKVSLPTRNVSPLDRSGHRFNYDNCTWIVGNLVVHEGIRPFIELEISPWDGVRTVYYSEWTREEKVVILSVAHVKCVHKALPRLVRGIGNKYPELKEAWKPLLDAAQ